MEYKKELLYRKVQKTGFLGLFLSLIIGIVWICMPEESPLSKPILIIALSVFAIGIIILIATKTGEEIRIMDLGCVFLIIGIVASIYFLLSNEFQEETFETRAFNVLSQYMSFGGITTGLLFLGIHKLKNK